MRVREEIDLIGRRLVYIHNITAEAIEDHIDRTNDHSDIGIKAIIKHAKDNRNCVFLKTSQSIEGDD